MSAFITLTPQPLTIATAAKGIVVQPLWSVVDVSRFDTLDLALGVLFLSNKVVATVSIETGMQNQAETQGGGDWQIAGAFPKPIVGAANALPRPQWQMLSIASSESGATLLKFVRWRVDLNGAGTATFFIRGLARRRAR